MNHKALEQGGVGYITYDVGSQFFFLHMTYFHCNSRGVGFPIQSQSSNLITSYFRIYKYVTMHTLSELLSGISTSRLKIFVAALEM